MTLATLRIAIVDDEAPARSRLRDLLGDCAEKQPLEVIGEAASGAAALELINAKPCDVVLLDVRMPGMDGIETAQHLRKLDHPPAIIFATAYDAYALKAFEVNAIDENCIQRPAGQGAKIAASQSGSAHRSAPRTAQRSVGQRTWQGAFDTGA